MTKKTIGFVTLRAQAFHSGHRHMLREAHSKCDFLLILIGSANSARTIKNPFTYLERKYEIEKFLQHNFSDSANEFRIYPLNDYKYSDTQWMSDVDAIISENVDANSEVVMFGHHKAGNHYLDWLAAQYKFVNIESIYDMNATEIRNRWFKNERHHFHEDVLADYDYFEKEKVTFANYPYPETLNFMCGDVVLECAGHILLIKRKHAPGRNTWALPGGFKNNTETSIDCAFRELIEETNVRVAEKVLRGSVVSTKLFDDPKRGMGIPRNALAVHIRIDLNADGKFPRISPKDDALEVGFFPIKTIMNDMELFDDHSGIISVLCSVNAIPAHMNPRFN